MKLRTLAISVLASVCMLGSFSLVHAKGPQSAPDIYDESADATKQIATALETAKKEHKNVLLQFGANWCIWCHRLRALFDTNTAVADVLNKNYVLVMVDVNKGHNKAIDVKYGHPTQFGIPALAVLDADGKQLTIKDSGQLEEGDHHSPEKVMAFLKEWAPKR